MIACPCLVAISYHDFFAIAYADLLVITGIVSFVTTYKISFLVSCSGLARCNAEGASPCACMATQEMTRSEVVANARQTGRHMEARYAGNCDIGQVFFSSF